MKKRSKLKKGLSILLTAAMVVGLMPGVGTLQVSAETTETPATAETPSITAYATAEQLKDANNFTLYTGNGSGVVQKVNFGTNGSSAQTWYIAGYEECTKSLVMMCDPESPLTYMPFLAEDKIYYGDDEKFYNNSNESNQVYANNYGASDLRAYLTGDALNNFTTAEQGLMVNTEILYSSANGSDPASDYVINDKLYAAANGKVEISGQADIKVGLNDSITVATGDNASPNSPYVNDPSFWRRTGFTDTEYVYVNGGRGTSVWDNYPVVPAFHLNMSSVLFASGAPAGTSDASLSGAMTFRYKGTDKVTSTAVYEANGVKVTEGGDNEYLYIQWKENDTDKVYSKQITSDMNISRGSLGVDSFENCKIWIEKVEDNISYAVEATKTEGHDFSAQTISDNAKKSNATCTEKAKYYYSCSVCGEVEKNDEHVFENGELAEHTDENLDGKCDVCNIDFKSFEQLGKLITKVNQNLSDGKYADVQYTTASIDNLRKTLVAANAITAQSSDTEVTEAYDNLLAASTVDASGLIKADKNIVISFADSGAVRGIAAGNGWYANGDTVTLKVTPSVGYTFSKWTTDTAGDISVGTESTYTFTLAEDSPSAYYAWLDEVKYTVTCNTAEGGTCSTDAEGGKYVYGQTAKVTATAAENYAFVGWKDSYGTTVSTDNIYSFTVIGNTTLTPEFVKVKTDEGADITYVTVSFYHQSGKLLDSQKVVSDEGKITTTVNAPTKVGFDFLGWSTKASGATAEDVVDFSTATFSEDTSLYPVFKAQDITYTLTVDLQAEQKAPQSSVTVTADPIEGKQFVGWKNADGNIVSYDSTYTFIITGDTTLTSYYEPISAVIEKTPTISMSAPVGSVKEEGISKKATMYFNYEIPENYTLTDIGVIYISGEVEELDINTTGAVIRSAKSTIENTSNAAKNQFYYSKTVLSGQSYTFVGYITYTDAAGRRITVYSNQCSANYQGL